MQKLKPKVKDTILKHALVTFYVKGYENTTMRRIAAKSHITVGNIYRYFMNKEALFDHLILEAYETLYAFAKPKLAVDPKLLFSDHYINDVLSEFSEICLAYPKHIVIILERYFTQGQYSLFDDLELLVTTLLRKSDPTLNDATVRLLNYLLLQGVLFTLKQEKTNKTRDQLLILFNVLFNNIKEQFKNEENI